VQRQQALVALFAVGITACDSEPSSNPAKEAFAQIPKHIEVGAAVAFRFPANGREAVLYRIPDLEAVAWSFEIDRQSTERIVGFSSDNSLIFTLAEREDSLASDLRALDLVTGRSRTLDSNVIAATVGPTGRAFLIRADGSVGQAEHRSVDNWPDTLQDTTLALWGAARNRLVALLQAETGREVAYLARGQEPIRQPVPAGDIAVSTWGRLVAVATDSGLVTLDPADPDSRGFAELSPAPQTMTISPAGHRIYVALSDERLVAVDRYASVVVQDMQLTDPALDLRAGPLGQTLLVRTGAESFLVIGLIEFALLATIEGSWDEELPVVAPDGTILAKQGNRIVAYEGPDYREAASVSERPGDRWLAIGWDPRRPALEFAIDRAPTEEASDVEMYVQVSSSGNPAWAEDLATELRAAGLNAKVLPPDADEERFRVVLGPFTTREEAEDNGRRLGRAFWIFTRETETDEAPEIP
jgi:hypothetical protein